MPSRTSTLSQFPWEGGVNTSLDEAVIPNNQLTKAENLIFGYRGSRKKREGIDFSWDDATTGTVSLIALHDFWYGTAAGKTQKLIAVGDDEAVYTYNISSGARTTITDAGTAWANTVTTASIVTFNNLCIIAVDGDNNLMKKWTGSGDLADLGGTPPDASICREHLGRLWANDKDNVDRLHYSTTANPEEWNGAGDSAALDIGVGDGDPDGITAIFPTFKGELFVAKRTKLYRVSGDSPENFQVILVSNGIGCVSHNSIATVDQDDIVFASDRGFHSLSATMAYGDFAGAYLSKDIQRTFNENFTKSRRKYIWGAYLSEINSIAFAVTDNDYSASINKAIWLYNLDLKAWYTWPDIACQSMIVVRDSTQSRFYLGTNVSRVGKAFNGTNYDISTADANTAIQMTVETGIVFPLGDPSATVGFKKFTLIYRPTGTHTITVSLKIDNYEVQSLAFTDTSGADLLGSTFILGTSILGSSRVLAPYTLPFDGYGRGVKITITQSGTDEQAEIQGFSLEYEPAGLKQEVSL